MLCLLRGRDGFSRTKRLRSLLQGREREATSRERRGQVAVLVHLNSLGQAVRIPIFGFAASLSLAVQWRGWAALLLSVKQAPKRGEVMRTFSEQRVAPSLTRDLQCALRCLGDVELVSLGLELLGCGGGDQGAADSRGVSGCDK